MQFVVILEGDKYVICGSVCKPWGIFFPVLGPGLPGMKRIFEFVRCLEMDLSGLLLELEEFLGRSVCEVKSEFLPSLPLESSRSLVDLRRGT